MYCSYQHSRSKHLKWVYRWKNKINNILLKVYYYIQSNYNRLKIPGIIYLLVPAFKIRVFYLVQKVQGWPERKPPTVVDTTTPADIPSATTRMTGNRAETQSNSKSKSGNKLKIKITQVNCNQGKTYNTIKTKTI